MRKPYGLIYCATNKKNGKKYIGKTTNHLQVRIWQHTVGTPRQRFAKELRKFGASSFSWRILEKCHSPKKLSEREVYFIKYFKSHIEKFGYNSHLARPKRLTLHQCWRLVIKMMKKKKTKMDKIACMLGTISAKTASWHKKSNIFVPIEMQNKILILAKKMGV